MPTPAVPRPFITPVLSRVMTLVVSEILADGVNVAVQVMPPSLLLTALKVPLAMVRSALVKPVTASEKVIVTKDVSPMLSVVSATTMVAVGGGAYAVLSTPPSL
ncbi:hypothetical protein D3C85_430850 [compost metagenome]